MHLNFYSFLLRHSLPRKALPSLDLGEVMFYIDSKLLISMRLLASIILLKLHKTFYILSRCNSKLVVESWNYVFIRKSSLSLPLLYRFFFGIREHFIIYWKSWKFCFGFAAVLILTFLHKVGSCWLCSLAAQFVRLRVLRFFEATKGGNSYFQTGIFSA